MTTATTTMLDIALADAALGIHVFPICEVRPNGRCACGKRDCSDVGKHPRWHEVDLEHGFKDATTDEAIIRTWWTRWPRANIGWATGPSRLAVFDEDEGGEETLAELVRQYGPLPASWESVTGSDGRHLVYLAPPGGIPCTTATLGPGLDTRGEGGYIVAPGSRHRSGRCYRWKEGHSPADRPLAPAPDWLLLALAEANAPASTPPRPPRGEVPSPDELREMLGYIPPQGTYLDWLRVLAGIHSAYPGPEGVALAEGWSPGKPGEVERKFRSFRRGDDGKVATIGTVIYIARQHGYQPPPAPTPAPTPIGEAPSCDPLARIAELERQLAERDAQLAERDRALAECRKGREADRERIDQLARDLQAAERALTCGDPTAGAVAWGRARVHLDNKRRGRTFTPDGGRPHVRNTDAEVARAINVAGTTVGRATERLLAARPPERRLRIVKKEMRVEDAPKPVPVDWFDFDHDGDLFGIVGDLLPGKLSKKPRGTSAAAGDLDAATTVQTVTTEDKELSVATGQPTREPRVKVRTVWRDAGRKVLRVTTTGDRKAGADATDAVLQIAGIGPSTVGLQFAARAHERGLVVEEDGPPAAAPPPKPPGLCKTRDCRNLAMVEGYCPWHDPNRRDQLHRERQYDHYAAAGA